MFYSIFILLFSNMLLILKLKFDDFTHGKLSCVHLIKGQLSSLHATEIILIIDPIFNGWLNDYLMCDNCIDVLIFNKCWLILLIFQPKRLGNFLVFLVQFWPILLFVGGKIVIFLIPQKLGEKKTMETDRHTVSHYLMDNNKRQIWLSNGLFNGWIHDAASIGWSRKKKKRGSFEFGFKL